MWAWPRMPSNSPVPDPGTIIQFPFGSPDPSRVPRWSKTKVPTRAPRRPTMRSMATYPAPPGDRLASIWVIDEPSRSPRNVLVNAVWLSSTSTTLATSSAVGRCSLSETSKVALASTAASVALVVSSAYGSGGVHHRDHELGEHVELLGFVTGRPEHDVFAAGLLEVDDAFVDLVDRPEHVRLFEVVGVAVGAHDLAEVLVLGLASLLGVFGVDQHGEVAVGEPGWLLVVLGSGSGQDGGCPPSTGSSGW